MGELRTSGCSVTGEPNGSIGVARHSIVESAAQDLLDYPEAISGIRAKLRTGLQTHFGFMSVHNPGRAAYLVTKYEKVAVEGAFKHLAGDHLLGSVLPRLKDGESLIPNNVPQDPEYYIAPAMPYSLDEPYHTFMRVGTYWWQGAEQSLFDELEQTPGHLYQPLLTQAASLHAQYSEIARTYAPQRQLGADFKDYGRKLAIDNVLAVMNVMVGRQLIAPSELNADQLTRRAIRDTDRLSWLSTTNRNILAQHFPYPEDYVPPEGDIATAKQNVIFGKGRIDYWLAS